MRKDRAALEECVARTIEQQGDPFQLGNAVIKELKKKRDPGLAGLPTPNQL